MRGLMAIGVGIVVISLASVVVVALAANRGPAIFPPDSPEAALQAYLEAFEAGDYAPAYAFFSSDVQATMSATEFEAAAQDYAGYRTEAYRVTFDGTEGSGDRVTVQVTQEVNSGGGLTTDRYSYQTVVPMVRENGSWRIDEALVFLDPRMAPEAPVKVD
jgi:hypothetical protein